MRSTKATLATKDGQAHFQGKGWGHGVGLCQWGAKAQSQLGKDYLEILTYYYPASRVDQWYGFGWIDKLKRVFGG